MVVKGRGVSDSIAIGRLYFLNQDSYSVNKININDKTAEKARFNNARTAAREQLEVLYEKAVLKVGEAGAMIFRIHQLIIDDVDYIASVNEIIDGQSLNVEYAISSAADKFAQIFAHMDDEYMKARAADIYDVSERMLKILTGRASSGIQSEEPVIIAVNDLAPSQTVQLDKSRVLGFVTFRGSSNSHTAILARTMNLPAVVGTGEIDSAYNGMLAVINGIDGTVIIEPDSETLDEMKRLKEKSDSENQLLLDLKGKANITQDGREIRIYANINTPADTEAVLKNDAGGIGLFRSEFLYLGNSAYPTEEQQLKAYRDVVRKMEGKRVVIRTLDLGADKTADYFGLDNEENPALGYRAIRISLSMVDMFKTQLRAVLRASAYGNVSLLFPMIISLDEVRRIKAIVAEVKAELDNEGISFDRNIKLGIMIETPAAALISETLAREVDFFSIGTNDLSQYTLAIDRQNSKLDEFFDPHHEAVMQLIRMTVQNAHKAGISCGICGELGADTELVGEFIKMGVDELSVSPNSVLKVRKKIRSLDLS